MKRWLFILAVLPMLFTACREDLEEITVTGVNYQPPQVIVTASLSGKVTNENGDIVSGATVRLGDLAAATDENGFFQFLNTEMNSRGTYVTVYKEGYFPGSTRLFPLSNSSNFVTIGLLPKTIQGSFVNEQGGEVTVDGARVVLPANGVSRANGTPYEGEVRVAAQWINPTADNLFEIMPGNLQGVSLEGEEVSMATFGMLAVELQDAAGNELQVAAGRRAELTFPVPAELLGNAPAEIPLWSFDEDLGLWIEEGAATLQGDTYVGEVSHFSFWNCDYPFPVVTITGSVVDDMGNPVGNQLVRITLDNVGIAGYGYTNTGGEFSGLVPADEPLTLEIVDECGVLFSEMVGPFSEDATVGPFTLLSNPSQVGIMGQLEDCDGLPVSNGFVQLSWAEESVTVLSDENGLFSTTVLQCDPADVLIQAFDIVNGQQTTVDTLAAASTIDAGTVTVCDEVLEAFISWEVDGEAFYSPLPSLELNEVTYSPDSINFFTYHRLASEYNDPVGGGFNRIELNFADIATGTYTGVELLAYAGQEAPTGGFYLSCPDICLNFSMTVTATGEPGEYLEGEFSGTLDGWGGNQQQLTDVPVSGSFRVQIPQ